MNLIYLLTIAQIMLTAPRYRATYKLTYCPDSTNLNRKHSEYFSLYLATDKMSFYASEGFLKRDSVSSLVKTGLLSENDIMADSRNRFTTKFPQFLVKSYVNNTIKTYETIGVTSYTFLMKNELKWSITSGKDTLAGYACVKAITSHAGRNYEAWFAPEIPVPDGPYIFGGLPGLIIKINDTRNQYTFTLTELKESSYSLIEAPTYRKQQPIAIDRSKAFILREECRKDPVGCLAKTIGASRTDLTFTPNGSSQSMPITSYVNRRWDNNPLELK